MNWLDVETKAILQRKHEPKLAPPKAGEFALVLLRKGDSEERLVTAIRRIDDCTEFNARFLARSPVPVTIHPGLAEEEALLGQFELICCDAVSIFIRSEIILQQDDDYLKSLYFKILQSQEFQPVPMEIIRVPETESGEHFAEQFLGLPLSELKNKGCPCSTMVTFKKARIMKHWAVRIEAEVRCDNVPDTSPDDEIQAPFKGPEAD